VTVKNLTDSLTSVQKSFVVNIDNVAPTAVIKAADGTSSAPTTGTEGTQISLTGFATDASSADQAAGFDFEWTVTQNGNLVASQSNITDSDSFSFTPDDAGTYLVTLNATDKDGGTSKDVTLTINVVDAPLTDTTAAATVQAVEGQSSGDVVLMTFSDANPGAPLSDYSIDSVDWGGTVIGTPTTSIQAVSQTATSSTWEVIGNVVYADEGNYTVTVNVSDNDGSTASTSNTVFAVADVAPTVTSIASTAITTPENVPATNSGVFSDYDDAMTIKASQGSLTDNGDGTWSWTQTGDETDSGTVTVTATNSDGNAVSTSFAVTFTDVAPTVTSIASTSVSTPENVPATNSGVFSDYDDAMTIKASQGSLTDNGDGTWSWTGTGDAEDPYTVTITATNADGSTAATSFSVTFTDVTPTMTVSGDNSVAEGASYVLTLSKVVDDASDSVTSYTINWGDTTSTTILSADLGADRQVQHTFAEEGSANISVDLTTSDGTYIGVASHAVTITDAELDASSNDISATEGLNSGTQTLATFTDLGGAEDVSEYSATVIWDTNASVPVAEDAVVVSDGNGGFLVQGAHTYAEEGAYNFRVSITHENGITATVDGTATVDDAPLQGSGVDPLTAKEGTPKTFVVATFTDDNPNAPLCDFTATIDWGDGSSPTDGVISQNSDGSFSVSGTHTYPRATKGASDTITVDVSDVGGAATETTSYVTVSNISPTPSISGPLTGVPGESLSYTGNFSDPGEAGGETYTFTWKATKSGSTTPVQTGTDQNFCFTPTSLGTYTISFKVADDAGGSGTVTKTVTVKAVDLQTDPNDPTKTALVVGGTTGDDTIVIQRAATAGFYTVVLNGVTQGTTWKPTGHIIVYGVGGKDNIKLLSNSYGSVTIPALLFAGPGSADGGSILNASGSTANNVLVGGAGKDTLTAGTGASILIGGDGSDTLNAMTANALMIGGRTSFDNNLPALFALMAEWGRTDVDFATRKGHLTGETTSGLNGSSNLVSSGTGQTIFGGGSSGDQDTFSDSAGAIPDWIWELELDDITGLHRSGDVITPEHN
jgi:hypothetical protein